MDTSVPLNLTYNGNSTVTLSPKLQAAQNNQHIQTSPMFKIPSSSDDLFHSFDMGRESLGAQKCLNLFDFSKNDSFSFGRESVSAFRESVGFGKESLGILKNDTTFEYSFIETDPRSILPSIVTSDYERESLGILNLKTLNTGASKDLLSNSDNFLSWTTDTSNHKLSVFEKGFLFPPERSVSVSSSISSNSKNPSFNSKFLDEPSRIYSVSSFKDFNSNESDNILNNGLCNSTNKFINSSDLSACSPIYSGKLNNGNIQDSRFRIQSLPLSSPKKLDPIAEVSIRECPEKSKRQFFSCEPKKKFNVIKRNSFHGVLNFDEEDENVFYDSVFMVGRNLSEKMADGSIYESSEGNDQLESVTPPDSLIKSETEEKHVERCDSETIFKSIEEIITVTVPLDSLKIRSTSKYDSSNSNGLESDNRSVSNSKRSESVSTTQETKDILQNLSDILSSNKRSDLQKSEGKKLLYSLAGILCENNNSNHDDSGHSSNGEQQDCFSELDDRMKDLPDDPKSKDVPAEVIVKTDNKRFSRSFSVPCPKISDPKAKENNSNPSKNSSISRHSSVSHYQNKLVKQVSLNSDNEAFKPKPLGKSGTTKKGPLKATIPVANMIKKSHFSTPTKSEQKVSSIIQSNRTSTPINEPNLKPMAQSTPTEKLSVSKLPRMSPMSKLPRSLHRNSIAFDSKEHKTPLKLQRRNSVSEPETGRDIKLKRSNSLGKDVGIMAALSRVRQNIAQKLNENSSKLLVKNGVSETKFRQASGTTPSKIRKFGNSEN